MSPRRRVFFVSDRTGITVEALGSSLLTQFAELDFLKGVPVDGYLKVTGGEARDTARALAKTEGIFGGFSAGANVAAALQLLAGELRGKTVAVVIPDSGLKYLSTNLWT